MQAAFKKQQITLHDAQQTRVLSKIKQKWFSYSTYTEIYSTYE